MKIINKFFGDKTGNTLIYILLAIGILLVVGGSSLSVLKKTPESPPQVVKEDGLEERLSQILSKIKGAGNVDVMIVEDNDGEKSFGYDTNGKDKKTVILNKQNGDEPLISETTTPRIRGVLIVADGGGTNRIKEALIKSTQTALGIAAHKIVVYERTDLK